MVTIEDVLDLTLGEALGILTQYLTEQDVYDSYSDEFLDEFVKAGDYVVIELPNKNVQNRGSRDQCLEYFSLNNDSTMKLAVCEIFPAENAEEIYQYIFGDTIISD